MNYKIVSLIDNSSGIYHDWLGVIYDNSYTIYLFFTEISISTVLSVAVFPIPNDLKDKFESIDLNSFSDIEYFLREYNLGFTKMKAIKEYTNKNFLEVIRLQNLKAFL
jgi:hypothetical protein